MSNPIKHIRLVSPSRSYADIDFNEANRQIRDLGDALGISFSWGKYSSPADSIKSFSPLYEVPSPFQRLEELKDAFEDDSVDALWCLRGGDGLCEMFSLLKDYTPNTPKPILGMSDNTTIHNWLYHKTGVSGFYAPVVMDFSRNPGPKTMESLRQIIQGNTAWEMGGSSEFVDFLAHLDGSSPVLIPSDGPWVVQEGEVADSKMMVGLLRNLVREAALGWLPNFSGMILALDVVNTPPRRFSSDLELILNMPGAENLAGLLIGRVPPQDGLTRELLTQIIATKEELKGKPVVANLDFGHTYPITTIPFVSRANLVAHVDNFSLTGNLA